MSGIRSPYAVPQNGVCVLIFSANRLEHGPFVPAIVTYVRLGTTRDINRVNATSDLLIA